jgi:hypothetical protein
LTSDSTIERNKYGIQHDVAISIDKQRELAGWFKPFASSSYQYKPVLLPNEMSNLQIDLKPNEFRYIITKRVSSQLTDPIQSKIVFQVNFNNIIEFYSRSIF